MNLFGLEVEGSSPLARGLLDRSADQRQRLGIIPARAGFTGDDGGDGGVHGDHPRSRGVYGRASSERTAHRGSSPLARGLLSLHLRIVLSNRIIPARAGFTVPGNRCVVHSTDHPRSRGVYPGLEENGVGDPGSSPLARGLRGVTFSVPLGFRIIPARAGFTPSSMSCCPTRRDHPRSRGVYSLPDS